MTRERAKELLPVIQAYVDGKDIQRYNGRNEWIDVENPNFGDTLRYRVKPEEEFRPFKDRRELVETMVDHRPFGWARFKENKAFCQILYAHDNYIVCANGGFGITYSYEDAFECMTFLDGNPFGVKEE